MSKAMIKCEVEVLASTPKAFLIRTKIVDPHGWIPFSVCSKDTREVLAAEIAANTYRNKQMTIEVQEWKAKQLRLM